MKKIIVFLCFLAGAICFISAGLYINKEKAGIEDYVEQPSTKNNNPELLSEINMTQYVSLPASFYDVDIVEDIDNIEITEENVDEIMYEQLQQTAVQLPSVNGDNKTLIVNYTITQDGSVKEVKNNIKIGYNTSETMYDETVYAALKDATIGTPIHVEDVNFDGYNKITLDITILTIYDMPYPVTDKYINNNTEYSTVYNMRTALINDASGEAKRIAREHTISTLIDRMIEQTTFIKLPESLINKEFETLSKDNPDVTYDEAKHSLYKIFFISAVLKDYNIATKTDIEKRYSKLDPTETAGLTPYEIERKKYLLFEDDVVTCIYKKIQVTQTSQQTDS